MVKKLITLMLFVIVVAFFLGLYYWAVYIQEWPWWFGLSLVAGICGLIITVLFLRKYILRARERRFVQRIIDQDDTALKGATVSARYQLQELQERWKQSIEELRRSHLRNKGNPLYVLPWFLILGESGVGKTTVIQNSKLSSPLTDVSKAAGISGTRNCDWWFFNEAIILDTAGRYSVPVDEDRDKEEWQEFLTLLAKYRKKEPLNGVIITVSVDSLKPENEAKLKEDGQILRKRVDHLMHALGYKFPVYILVTKMDMMLGFIDFFSMMPKDRIEQAMGYVNNKRFDSWTEVVDKAQDNISETLQELRLMLIHEEIDDGEPTALLFPSEFGKIFGPLRDFLNDLFEENPYQETPHLRGIFFTSSVTAEKPLSDLMPKKIIDPDDEEVLIKKDDDYFVRDFFQKILPRDRKLYEPLQEFVLWKRITRRQGVLSLLLITLAIVGILSFSFYLNMRAISGFTSEFYNPPVLTLQTKTDILILERLRNELLKLEKLNQSWLITHLSYDHSYQVEQLIKKHYDQQIRDRVFHRFDEQIMASLGTMNADASERRIGDFVDYYLYRVYLLELYEKSNGEEVPAQFQEVVTRMLMSRDPELSEEIAAKFSTIYLTYLQSVYPDQNVKPEQTKLQLKIYDILSKEKEGLRWFVRNWTLSNWNIDAPDIRITDFCGDLEVGYTRDIIAVSGAYTKSGRDLISKFKTAVEEALPDTAERDTEFWSWYYQRFFRQWKLFSQYMEGWLKGLNTNSDWEYMASLMTKSHNPYFLLIIKMAEEFREVPPEITVPEWAKLILRLDEIRNLAEIERQKEEGSFTAKLSGTKEKLVQKTLETVDVQKAKELEQELSLAKLWHEYLLALEKAETYLFSQEMCFKLATGYFAPDSQPDKSLTELYDIYVKFSKFKYLMSNEGDTSVGLELVNGPHSFLTSYITEKTACVLQDYWEKEVLSEVRGVDNAQISKILFDEQEGAVWQYLDGVAKPFIDRGRKGYFSRRIRQAEIPFTNEFFNYLNKGKEGVIAYKPEYEVNLEALPMTVNEGALLAPFACTIMVSCAKEKQYLENYNYPTSRTFKWSPDSCGRTMLTIMFPEITMYREYNDTLAFARFLREFQDGKKTFTPDDFPEVREIMLQRNITEITISYNITGGNEVIRLLNKVPDTALSKIVQCWLR